MSRFFAPVARVTSVVCLAATTGIARQAVPSPLAADTSIVGHVSDRSTGRQIPGAIVTVVGSTPAKRVVAGSAGEFEFLLPPGSYTVRADRPGYLPFSAGQLTAAGLGQPILLKSGDHADVPLAMWKAGVIAGTVTVANATGDPVVGAEIHALSKTVAGGAWQWVDAGITTSDDHGRYRIGNLAPADYLVVARPPQNPETPLLVAMLTANSALAADVMANVASTSHEVPDVDRRVLASSLAVAARTLGASGQSLAIAVDGGTTRSGVDLRVAQSRGVRVAGRLTGVTSPAAGTIVELLAPVPNADGRDRPDQQIQVAASACDGDGRFEFTAVTAGAYTLAVTWMPPLPPAPPTPPGPASGRGSPLFSSDPALWARLPIVVGTTDMTSVAVPISTGTALAGHVSVTTQSPSSVVANLGMTSLRLEPVVAPFVPVPTVIAPRVVVDGSGQISSASIPPGRYWLRVGAPAGFIVLSATAGGIDVLDRPIDISATAADLTVTLTDARFSNVAGVVTSSGVPATDAVTVLAFPAKADQRQDSTPASRRVRAVRAQLQGLFSVGPLPPGDYCVVAIPGDAPRGWQTEESLAALAASATHVTVLSGPLAPISLEVKR